MSGKDNMSEIKLQTQVGYDIILFTVWASIRPEEVDCILRT